MSVAWEQTDLTPSPEPLSMDRIGEYLVRRLIGEGGMGKVYEAEERLSKRRVALKVLRDELSQSEDARRLFLNEMQILAHLEHPNIVRSLASIESDGQLVTVLEFLEGRTLRQLLIERGSIGWEHAVHVVACVAQALVAAHGQSPPVIHRDLKPENIMLLDGGTVKVMDFGIAKLVQELNQTNTQSVGTLQYMSPEQIDAQTIDVRADLYCLGLVFYELVTGRPPFQSASPRTLLNMQCTERPPPLDDELRLPKGIRRLLFKLLEKAPEDRPASAAEVVDTLEPFLPDGDAVELGVSPAGAAAGAGVTVPESPPFSGGKAVGSGSQSGSPQASGEERTMPSADVQPGDTGDKVAARAQRKDTIALIDAASEPRELSIGVALLIVLLLMAVAGAATYFWRATQVLDSRAATEISAESHRG